MNRPSQSLSVACALLVLTACEATGPQRKQPGYLPASLASYDGLDPMRTGAAAPTVLAPAPNRAATEPRVPTVRGLSFRDEPLDDAFRTLATVSGAPILVTPAARQVIRDEDLKIDLDLSVALPLPRVLDLMTGVSPELDHEYRSGVWQVARRDEGLGGERISRMFDVRDLVAPRTVFLPPTMTGIPNGESDEFGRSGGEAEDKVRAMEPDELVMLVQDSLGPENFAPEGPVTLEFVDSGYLLLTGPRRAVERLAGRL